MCIYCAVHCYICQLGLVCFAVNLLHCYHACHVIRHEQPGFVE